MALIIKYKKPIKKEPVDKKLPIRLSNRLYVPYQAVTKDTLNNFTVEVGQACKNCNCGDKLSCPAANIQQIEMFKEFQDGDYYGFARGDIGKLKENFKEHWNQVEDERSRHKMKIPISFTGKLRPLQQKTVDKWLEKKYGLIQAPPRSGKTVLLTYLICQLGYQALILVHQDELAQQFYNTFMNINNNNIEFTDAPYLEKKHKKTIVGIARSIKDLEQNWPVTIMTYQKFLRKMKTLKKMRDKWGQVWVDECHYVNAPRWSEIVSILNPKIRAGCSATPKRKDGLHVISDHILGPVTSVGFSDQMVCKVKFINTEHTVNPFKMYTTFISRLCADNKRNELIVDEIMKDADKGRFIMATTMRVGHAKTIAKMLEREGYEVGCLVGNSPNRKQLLDNFKSGKIQILIASRKITQVGLDIPRMDSMHILLPNFNEYNFLQEVSRVRTPYDGKPQPLVRVYIDKGHKITHAVRSAFDKVFRQENFEYESSNTGESKKVKSWI